MSNIMNVFYAGDALGGERHALNTITSQQLGGDSAGSHARRHTYMYTASLLSQFYQKYIHTYMHPFDTRQRTCHVLHMRPPQSTMPVHLVQAGLHLVGAPICWGASTSANHGKY
jgi:hypothetical protein